MLDINDFMKIFENNKQLLIETLISYYGEEYRDLISRKIKDTYYNFSSPPTSEYTYILNNIEEFNRFDLFMIKRDLETYKKVEVCARNIGIEKLLCSLIGYFGLRHLKNDDGKVANIVSLFSSYQFEEAYIDSFSTANTRILNDKNAPDFVRKRILKQQQKFIREALKFDLDFNYFDSALADQIIRYRSFIRANYLSYIAKNTKYGKTIYKDVKKRFDLKLDALNLGIIAFPNSAHAATITFKSSKGINYYKLVRFPIINFLNKKFFCLDVCLIHELIHVVESDGLQVGISIYDSACTNKIANEIRTQKIAIKLAEMLHKKEIFIYDDPNNYFSENKSDYEKLFPLTFDFFDKHERFISSCAINNTPSKLVEYFGEGFKIYSEYLNDVYNNYMGYLSNGCNEDFSFYQRGSDLIENMENYYEAKMGRQKGIRK